MDHGDAAGWKRLHSVAPWAQRIKVTIGAAVSKAKPWIGSGYFYPVLVTNSDFSAETVYGVVKGINDSYDDFKKSAPGVAGWHKSRQNFQWVVPWHPGAIKYWKEAGVWSAAATSHNDGLLKRQGVLAAAWKKYKSDPHSDFQGGWMKARSAALGAAGLAVVFN